jgi:hypothetical protein
MSATRRAAIGSGAAIALIVLAAAPGMAHECVNPDKQPGAGAQVIINVTTDAVTFANPGIEKRFTSGVTSEETFRGLIGLDFDGDGQADLTTWIVGKYGEIPEQAQLAGAACHGVLNIDAYFTCMEAELSS